MLVRQDQETSCLAISFLEGAAYSCRLAMSAIVGFQATDSWFMGYENNLETTN